MRPLDIIRAWKERQYYASLSAEEQALLPLHPAGTIELNNDELESIAGAELFESCMMPDTCGLRCMSPFCLPTAHATCPMYGVVA